MKGRIKIRGDYRSLLIVFPAAIILLFAFFVLFPIVAETTHAEGDEPDDGITVVANNNIEINLLSTDEGYYKIAKDTVTVSTGSEYGYTLYLSTDSAAHQSIYLNGDTSSERKISGTTGTYESPVALADEGYSWGWAVPEISHFDNTYNTANPDAKSKFAVMPLENKIIHEYTTEATEDTTDVYYGFKLEGALELGKYKTAISYTAVSADAPLTAKAVLGDNNNLNFLYDRKTYTAGEIYTDNIGNTTVTNVYNIPLGGTTSSQAWTQQSDSIFTANFDGSFANMRPTSMATWFRDLKKLNTITNHQNLNTSMVKTMYQAFAFTGQNTTNFNFDLSGWNTSNVTDMSYIFARAGESATTFNLNIDGWDTSNTTSFLAMFYRAGFSATDWSIGDIGGWNTGNVIDCHGMFNRAGNSATTFDIGNLGGWNTGKIQNMNTMFGQAGSNATVWNIGDISGWNTSNVTDMSWMFNQAGRNAEVWNIGDISGWNTGNVTNMSYMFPSSGENAASWNIGDIGGWDTSNVTDMSCMFDYSGKNATSWNAGNLSGWNTSNVTDMHNLFYYAGYNADTWNVGDLSGWNTGNVTTMEKMFYGAGHNASVWDIGNLNYVDEDNPGWNVDNVTNHDGFVDWNQTNIDLSRLPWQSN